MLTLLRVGKQTKTGAICFFSFVSNIESTFTASIFAQFSASILVICITGFELSVVSIRVWRGKEWDLFKSSALKRSRVKQH